MATQVDLGKIRPVWKGDWAASTAYEQNDMVKEGVHSYICTAAHTSGSTFTTTNWSLIAAGVEFPTQAGNTDKFLTTDGSTISWGDVPAGVEIFKTSGDMSSVSTGNFISVYLDFTPSVNCKGLFGWSVAYRSQGGAGYNYFTPTICNTSNTRLHDIQTYGGGTNKGNDTWNKGVGSMVSPNYIMTAGTTYRFRIWFETSVSINTANDYGDDVHLSVICYPV